MIIKILEQYTSVDVKIKFKNFLIFFVACGCDNEIRPKENIQCKECSGRIFYKKRTRRLVQYEAR